MAEEKTKTQKTKEFTSKYSKTILFGIVIITAGVLTGIGVIDPQSWLDLIRTLLLQG